MATTVHPRHWDPNIPQSSATASTAASARSFPLESKTDLTSLDQFAPSASRTSHSVEDGDMSTQQWASLASTLGIQSTDTPRSSPEAQKSARKMGKRRTIPEKQLTELLLPLITSITSSHTRLLPALSTTFNREAVPLDHPSFIFNKTRLPTPRPAITLGYNPQIFHPHYRELMEGIISDSSGQPRNLDKISSACPGTYWPFFVVEISDDSYSPSQAAASAAAATATCNNALLTLASVLNDVSNPIEHDPSFRDMLTTCISSFSLAITSQIKSATLFAHTTSFSSSYDSSASPIVDAVEPIKTYNLQSPVEVEHLSSRLNSIFPWANETRLLAIMDLLDRFDERVRFKETKLSQEQELWGPMDVMQRGQQAPKLMPGMVQVSGGMGRGLSAHIPPPAQASKPGAKRISPGALASALPLGTSKDKEKEKAPERGRSESGSRNRAGVGKWMPDTPRTPESMKLNLNTTAAANAGAVGVNAKVKKGSLFKTVINDAMPAWTRVEI